MNEAKIKALLKHLQDGGSLDPEIVAGILGTTVRSAKTIEKYIEAVIEADKPTLDGIELGGANPYASDEEEQEEKEFEDEEDEEEEEEEEEEETPPSDFATGVADVGNGKVKFVKEAPPAPAKKAAKSDNAPYRFFYEGADGLSKEIEKVESKSKGKVITFRDKNITDIVSLMIKGTVVEVDIVALRKENPRHLSEHRITNELLLNLALAAKP